MNPTHRRQTKQARELLRGTRKLLRIHRDILERRAIEEFRTVCDRLAAALDGNDPGLVAPLVDRLEKQLGKSFPQAADAGIRENVEVLLIAVIVAMAVRCFFIQPFKIPTGSMQPTLYGITVDTRSDRNPSLGTRLADVVLPGKWPVAPRSGLLESAWNFLAWTALGIWPEGAEGYTLHGDHIFVDRFSYHFRKPKRGEVIVFDTSHIMGLPPESRGKFYIKRLIGLGNDTIQITPPYVRINGDILDGRTAFRRMYSMENGYSGYVVPDPAFFLPGQYFNWATDSYRVPADNLFVLGDNSLHSLDGRFWGSFPRKDFVGRALFVYWPITKRFGAIE